MGKFRWGTRAAALAGTSWLCFAATAMAGEANTTVPITALTAGEIENVVITGFLEEDLPTRLSQIGTRVDVVPGAQIQNSGAIDVSQALQASVPGLAIVPKTGGPFDYVDISFQGSRGQDVLWTLDGVRINNRLYGTTSPTDALPASMIERVEVLEGPQALFYGTQAIAGAINIVTKDYSDTMDFGIKAGGDTNGGYHVDGYFRDTLAGKHHFVVYASQDEADGFQTFREQDYQPSMTDRNRSYRAFSVGGKYAFDLTPDLRFSISELHNDARVDAFFGPESIANAFNDRNEDVLSAKVDYKASDNLQFFLKGYYHWWYSHYTEIDNNLDASGLLDGTTSVSDDHEFWGFTDYGLNAMAKFVPAPGIETYLGYDYQNYTGKDVVLVIEQQTEHVHAFFGEIATNRDLWSNFQIAAGFRYNAPDQGQEATVWNVMARWDITPDLYIKGLVGTAFRLPTAEELFANDICLPDCGERGNPNTKPEESFNFNGSIGGQLQGGMFRWEMIGFVRRIENQITLVDFDDVTGQEIFGNLPGAVDVHGGEFVLDAAYNDEFSGSASYTLSSSVNNITDQQINRVPESVAKLVLDYHPVAMPFGLYADMNFIGTTYDNPSGFGRTKYGNYAVFGIGGRYFVDMDRHHRLDLGIRNLFDTVYNTRLAVGFPDDGVSPTYLAPFIGAPRTLYGSYTYRF